MMIFKMFAKERSNEVESIQRGCYSREGGGAGDRSSSSVLFSFSNGAP